MAKRDREQELVDALAPVIRAAIANKTDPLAERLEALERRIAVDEGNELKSKARRFDGWADD